MLKVIILRGASGSGKSTYTNKNFPNAVVCSADHYFVDPVTGEYKFNFTRLGDAHGACLRKFTETVQTLRGDDVTVVVDNTNTSIAEIAPYAAIALAYGCEPEIITLLVNPEVAAARNVHGVSVDSVKRQRANLDEGTKNIPKWWRHSIIEMK